MSYWCISVTPADGIPEAAVDARAKACKDFWEACRRVASHETYHEMLEEIPAIEAAIAAIRQPLLPMTRQSKRKPRRKAKPRLRVHQRPVKGGAA